MSIKWTDEEEKFIFDCINNDFEYTYETLAYELNCESISPIYRTSEAIRKFISRRNEKVESKLSEIIIPKEVQTNKPKILIFDIETLPIKAYTWGIWKQNIGDHQIIEDWCILSWAAKWLYDSTIDGDILTEAEAIKRDDSRIVKSLWDYFNEADIIIGHNLDKFDIKKMNSRFFIHEITPPSPYVTIDTLKQSRACFGHTSHKLDYISQLINNKNKLKTEFGLWVACDKGESWALNKMHEYNKYDVSLTEEAFIQMIPWIRSIPNMALYINSNEPICCRCGSSILEPNGYYVTNANKYQSYRCVECGGFSRSRISSITAEQRKNLLISTAK